MRLRLLLLGYSKHFLHTNSMAQHFKQTNNYIFTNRRHIKETRLRTFTNPATQYFRTSGIGSKAPNMWREAGLLLCQWFLGMWKMQAPAAFLGTSENRMLPHIEVVLTRLLFMIAQLWLNRGTMG